MFKLPEKIVYALSEDGEDFYIPITTEKIESGVGYIQFGDKYKIVVEEDSTDFEKLIALIHELLHLGVESLKQQDIIRKAPSHEFISYISPLMAGYLVSGELINGLKFDDIRNEIIEGRDEA